jgi:hypothetical protein
VTPYPLLLVSIQHEDNCAHWCMKHRRLAMEERLPHRNIFRTVRHETISLSAATSSEIGEIRRRKGLGPLFLTMLSAGVWFFACYLLLRVSDAHDQNIRRQSVLTTDKRLPPWKPGMLDIHHLRVGPSEVCCRR